MSDSKKMIRTIHVGLRIDENLQRELNTLVVKQERSASQIIRLALKNYIELIKTQNLK